MSPLWSLQCDRKWKRNGERWERVGKKNSVWISGKSLTRLLPCKQTESWEGIHSPRPHFFYFPSIFHPSYLPSLWLATCPLQRYCQSSNSCSHNTMKYTHRNKSLLIVTIGERQLWKERAVVAKKRKVSVEDSAAVFASISTAVKKVTAKCCFYLFT